MKKGKELYSRRVFQLKHKVRSKNDIDRAELIRRTNDLGRENLKTQYSIVKAIGLTTATAILFNLLISHQFATANLETHLTLLLKLLLWMTTCMALILTYDAGMFGTTVQAKPHSGLAVLIMFSFIGFEFLLFAVLYPSLIVEGEFGRENILPNFAEIWFVLYGMYTLAIHVFCKESVRIINSTKFYSETVKQKFIDNYEADKKETLKVGIVSFLIVIFPKVIGCLIQLPCYVDIVFLKLLYQLLTALLVTIAIFDAYATQYKKRKEIRKSFGYENS